MKLKMLILILLSFNAIVYAQDSLTIASIKHDHEQISTITTKFTELQYHKSNRTTDELQGKIYFDAIGRLAMIYTEPASDYTIFDGTNLTMRHNGRKSHSDTKKKAHLAQQRNVLINSMNGDIDAVCDEINADIKTKKDKQYHVYILTRRKDSKTKKHDIKRIELRYDKHTSMLVYLSITEISGNTTTYAMQHPQINSPLPQTVFEKE